MSKSEKRRQTIFDKYRSNWNLLADEGYIKGLRDVYLCPVCLKPHKDIYGADPLTLEDAPPKSLGGSPNTLTCKSCNNKAGYRIDHHLTQRLRELDSASFIRGTETPVLIKVDGGTLRGQLSVKEDGTLSIYHSEKNNHPEKLEKAMAAIAGRVITMEFLKSRVIPENLEYALLKIAYIMAFQRFGYSLILESCFEIVRNQLQNPDARVYPEGFWFPLNNVKSGVYFVMDTGLESLLSVFGLDTGKSRRSFGVLLPLPINPIANIIEVFNRDDNGRRAIQGLTLYPLEQHNMNYLDNIDEIRAMHNWILERQGLNRN